MKKIKIKIMKKNIHAQAMAKLSWQARKDSIKRNEKGHFLPKAIIATSIAIFAIFNIPYTESITKYVNEFLLPEIVYADTTSYSALDSCHYGKVKCPMASGKKAYKGAVACPRAIELGTQIKINDKLYICEDRTAKRYDGRYDIWTGYGRESHQIALNYGIRKNKIEILK